MSAFLGHIHYWLYRKIRLVLEREAWLVEDTDAQLDDIGSELLETLNAMFGEPIPADVPLEEVIDHSGIHGWLQKQVHFVEAREATFIKDVLDCYDEEALAVVCQTFTRHGLHCGHLCRDAEYAQLQANGEPLRASQFYDLLQQYQLNGMPCDQADDVLTDEAQQYSWHANHRQQRLIWTRIGVSTAVMSKAYRCWMVGFFEGLEAPFTLSVDESSEPFTLTLTLM